MFEQPIHRLLVRKGIHLAMGLFAFSLVLGPRFAILLTAALSAFNAWVWPRLGGRSLWRDPQGRRDTGILAYPLILLVLTLCFHRRLDVVAATWGILALGDGMAAILGRTLGRRTLPWNPDKTWVGTLAYAAFGTLGAGGLLLCMASPVSQDRWIVLWLASALAAILAAAVESLPLGLDDNLTAPPLAALMLWGVLSTREDWPVAEVTTLCWQAGVGGVVALLLAVAAYRFRAVDVSGALAGWILATLITGALYWQGLLILGAFFVLGSATTRLGLARKQALGVAQAKGGRRSARNALANCGVPALVAVFAVTTAATEPLTVAFVAAFAAVLGDTVSSEVGQAWGGRPVMITTWKPVPAGENGGITWIGSLAGWCGGSLVACLGWALDLYGLAWVPWVIAASVLGNVLDSLLGATLERQGLLDNEGVNFAASLGAALFALGVAAWPGIG